MGGTHHRMRASLSSAHNAADYALLDKCYQHSHNYEGEMCVLAIYPMQPCGAPQKGHSDDYEKNQNYLHVGAGLQHL